MCMYIEAPLPSRTKIFVISRTRNPWSKVKLFVKLDSNIPSGEIV
jgi:hypothetical protein